MRHPLPLAVAVAIIAALVWVCVPGQISHAEAPIPPVIPAGGTTSQSGSAQSETTITIHQLQIQLTVPSDLSDLTWTVYGQQEARFSTKKLEAMDPDCNSINSPLGYARIGGPNDEHGILEQLIATFAHSYLYYFTPQGPCSADKTAEDLQGQLFPEMKDALKTAVQIGPSPEITSDIVLVVNDTYRSGDIASISIRNDGQVPYKYNPRQEACEFTFERDNRPFQIPPATHCDLPGDDAEIAPGQTVAVVQWSLDECTAPGFFCFGVRPLPTDTIRISGALDSVDGLQRAQFAKTVFITGPIFTSDIELTAVYIVSDPPSAQGIPVNLQLRNKGQIDYSLPVQAACYLKFKNPAGNLFVIPPADKCDSADQVTLKPGQIVNAVEGWKRDECTQFGPSSCLTAEPLPPGDYVISGALWSADKQSYTEFSQTLTISAPAPSQTVSPTPKVLPAGGGPPAGESTQWVLMGGALAAILCIACLTIAARKEG